MPGGRRAFGSAAYPELHLGQRSNRFLIGTNLPEKLESDIGSMVVPEPWSAPGVHLLTDRPCRSMKALRLRVARFGEPACRRSERQTRTAHS